MQPHLTKKSSLHLPHHGHTGHSSLVVRFGADWIPYTIPLLTFRVLHWSAPLYLGPPVPVCSLPDIWSLHSTGTNCLLVPRSSDHLSAAVLSRLLAQKPGMPCRRM